MPHPELAARNVSGFGDRREGGRPSGSTAISTRLHPLATIPGEAARRTA